MKYLLVIAMIFLLSGCMPDLQGLVKQQSENCATHFSGNLSGSMLGLQMGVVAFNIDCLPTGPTKPVPPATKNPL